MKLLMSLLQIIWQSLPQRVTNTLSERRGTLWVWLFRASSTLCLSSWSSSWYASYKRIPLLRAQIVDLTIKHNKLQHLMFHRPRATMIKEIRMMRRVAKRLILMSSLIEEQPSILGSTLLLPSKRIRKFHNLTNMDLSRQELLTEGLSRNKAPLLTKRRAEMSFQMLKLAETRSEIRQLLLQAVSYHN